MSAPRYNLTEIFVNSKVHPCLPWSTCLLQHRSTSFTYVQKRPRNYICYPWQFIFNERLVMWFPLMSKLKEKVLKSFKSDKHKTKIAELRVHQLCIVLCILLLGIIHVFHTRFFLWQPYCWLLWKKKKAKFYWKKKSIMTRKIVILEVWYRGGKKMFWLFSSAFKWFHVLLRIWPKCHNTLKSFVLWWDHFQWSLSVISLQWNAVFPRPKVWQEMFGKI